MSSITEQLTENALLLLKQLITCPSFSSAEDKTASLIEDWFSSQDIACHRHRNNVYAMNKFYDPAKPNLLLNSHHDTVRPNAAYTRDPFQAVIEDGKLYGLGSNDAGGCLVALLALFSYYYTNSEMSHNLIIVASAEEESSGPNGLNSVLQLLPPIELAIVGEPTQMHLAIAEKGLVVFEGSIKGTPSHAAHPNGNNAIYNSIEVLKWFKDYSFEKISDTLGETKITVTQIQAGDQHNVVPAEVNLVIDVRVNDCYTNQQIADILINDAPCELKARSLRLNSSSIDKNHLLIKAGVQLGRKTYGSPTLSDQAALSCQSLKLGPGDSTRSHSADEFIYVEEIEEGISIYIELLRRFLLTA
ncbi:MAG: M20 family metallo-hydrolase [Flavobacteriaceae bacterium]